MTRIRKKAVVGLIAVVSCGLAVWVWRADARRRTTDSTILESPGNVPSIPLRRLVTGTVVGSDGPLPLARVRWKGSADFVLSDARGQFEILASPGTLGLLTAAAEGHFIGSVNSNSDVLRIALRPLPSTDAGAYQWIDPGPSSADEQRCVRCHQEIYQEWSASGHARSVTNRRFQSLYEGTDWQGRADVGWNLKAEHPLGVGVCSSCHAPSLTDDDPAGADLTLAQGVARLGVHCDYCHKVQSVDVTTVGLTHGRFGMKLLRPEAGQQLFFGPLDDVDRGEDVFAPIYGDSRYCASCHEGIVFGVAVYTTYSEWLASPARERGQHCQSCHMASSPDRDNMAPGHGGITRLPATLSNHSFREPDGEMLRRALRVNLRTSIAADRVAVHVMLDAEQIGHRVPTGFVDRHLVLVVEGLSADGIATPRTLGSTIPEFVGPSLGGLPGRLFARQLRTVDGERPAPFWRAQSDDLDTRIDPRQIEHAVFEFPSDVRRVRVRLIYRRFWESVRLTKMWPDDTITLIDQTVAVGGREQKLLGSPLSTKHPNAETSESHPGRASQSCDRSERRDRWPTH